MFGRVKTFFSNIKKKFSLVEFIVGGYNFSTGTTCVGGSLNNYLAYEFSLRLIGNCIILGIVGSALAIIEVFPNPELVDKHAHFLNTYHGRGVLYMFIALISADSRGVADQHKWYVYLTWLNAATIAATSILYIVLGLVDMYWKPLPVSKSMTTKAKAGIKVLNSDSSDPIGVNKTESGWTVTNKDDERDVKPIQMQRRPLGDPFDQVSVDQASISQSGWKRDSSPSYASKGLPAPLMMESKVVAGGSTYSVDMSGHSYTLHQVDASFDSSKQWIKTPELASPDTLLRKVQQSSRLPRRPSNPFRGVRYTSEASSSQDHLLSLPVLGYSPQHRPSSSGSSSQLAYSQTQSPLGQSGWTLDEDHRSGQQAKRRQPSTSKHKRVFVPGIGSFDLSSGSESETDDIIASYSTQQDSDNDSVYSLGSDVDVTKTEKQGTARLGRKLTRKETRTYKAKLNRGMQRAMSQRQGSNAQGYI